MQPVRTQAVFQNGRIVLLARLEKYAGTTISAAQQADIDTITIEVYDSKDRKRNLVTSVEPDVSDVMFNATRTDSGWTLDSAQRPDPVSQLYGYNFRYVVPNGFFPLGDRDYFVEVKWTYGDAAYDSQQWIVPVFALRGMS